MKHFLIGAALILATFLLWPASAFALNEGAPASSCIGHMVGEPCEITPLRAKSGFVMAQRGMTRQEIERAQQCISACAEKICNPAYLRSQQNPSRNDCLRYERHICGKDCLRR
jgi:hypothetical protein